jgi:hypothetical protein
MQDVCYLQQEGKMYAVCVVVHVVRGMPCDGLQPPVLCRTAYAWTRFLVAQEVSD